MASGTINKPYAELIVDSVDQDNYSVPGNDQATPYISVAKEGYTPIGVVGVYLANASSGGARVSFVNICSFSIIESNFRITLRCTNSAAAKILIRVHVLYVKN